MLNKSQKLHLMDALQSSSATFDTTRDGEMPKVELHSSSIHKFCACHTLIGPFGRLEVKWNHTVKELPSLVGHDILNIANYIDKRCIVTRVPHIFAIPRQLCSSSPIMYICSNQCRRSWVGQTVIPKVKRAFESRWPH